MRKTKPDLLVRGTLLREVAALKRRVQSLEKAVWPTTPSSRSPKPAKRRLIEVDETTARRMTIDAFHQADRDEWLRKNPDILERRRTELDRLNAYLREEGFEPEPQD